MKGKLIEINESVVKDPKLIQAAPTSNGHIGLILPKLPDGLADVKARLITKQEYQDYISSKGIHVWILNQLLFRIKLKYTTIFKNWEDFLWWDENT